MQSICNICNESANADTNPIVVLQCSHPLCLLCLCNHARAFGASASCPFCRTRILPLQDEDNDRLIRIPGCGHPSRALGEFLANFYEHIQEPPVCPSCLTWVFDEQTTAELVEYDKETVEMERDGLLEDLTFVSWLREHLHISSRRLWQLLSERERRLRKREENAVINETRRQMHLLRQRMNREPVQENREAYVDAYTRHLVAKMEAYERDAQATASTLGLDSNIAFLNQLYQRYNLSDGQTLVDGINTDEFITVRITTLIHHLSAQLGMT